MSQLLSAVGQHLGSSRPAVQDVVPLPAGDPRGLVLPSALLPLTICGVIMAAAIGLVLAFPTAYFGGHGAGVHLTVLVVWIAAVHDRAYS